ncbi:unnamed protein product, partial [Amoebophrya sp. A25]
TSGVANNDPRGAFASMLAERNGKPLPAGRQSWNSNTKGNSLAPDQDAGDALDTKRRNWSQVRDVIKLKNFTRSLLLKKKRGAQNGDQGNTTGDGRTSPSSLATPSGTRRNRVSISPDALGGAGAGDEEEDHEGAVGALVGLHAGDFVDHHSENVPRIEPPVLLPLKICVARSVVDANEEESWDSGSQSPDAKSDTATEPLSSPVARPTGILRRQRITEGPDDGPPGGGLLEGGGALGGAGSGFLGRKS